MLRSDQIDLVSKALVKAQAKIKHAVKDSVNPHFKSKYSDLASVMDAIKEPFAENGLALMQPLSSDQDAVKCTTLILHESGQFIGSEMSMRPVRNDPQGLGSCATYLRRYMAAAAAAVASDDDDGNAASGKGTNNANPNQTPNTQAPSMATSTQSTVASRLSKAAANAPARTQVVYFSKAEPTHREMIVNFVKSKKALNLLDAMCERMEGKVISRDSIEKEWRVIDPEAPDFREND